VDEPAAIIAVMRRTLCQAALFCMVITFTASAVDLDTAGLQSALASIAQGFDGRIGACVQKGTRSACIRADDRFSLQSVVKLVVGVAVLDSVDRGQRRLDDAVIVHQEDLSLFVQPLAELVGPSGYRTTIGDLVRRAIIDSDSAAADFLIGLLGEPSTAQAVLNAKGISGIRVDRDERHLQTEIVGLTWRSEYVDAATLDRAIDAVPRAKRAEAYAKYQVDPRDTATPRGMATFLFRLAKGELLSKSSTEFVLKAMKECKTFPDRLKTGASPGWQIAHKTGTSGSWEGLTVATNDVGILTAPDGAQISIAVFVADSRKSSAERAAIFARISAAVIAHYR
jgi:beta-lactamase class A